MNPQIERTVIEFERGRLSRRELILRLTALAATGSLMSRAPGSPVARSTFEATEIDHIALSVTDVARSRDFYGAHLGLTVTSESERSCFMRCGHNFVALFKADKPRMHHYCYAVEGYEAADAMKRLEAAGLEPRRESNRVYFDDPDGLVVQVAAPYRRER